MNNAMFDIREGEPITLPCRHCSSVSLRLVVHPGITARQCPKCRGLTSFCIERHPAGLELRSRAVRETPEGGVDSRD